MGKLILDIRTTSPDDKSATVKAVFDSGAFYSILREDKVPKGAAILKRKVSMSFGAAAKGSKFSATGELSLVMSIRQATRPEGQINDIVLISPELSQEMLVGAGTMQKWDICILNRDGKSALSVGRDMRDPQITEV